MVVLTTIVGGITQIPHGNQDLHNIHLLNLHVMPPLLRSNHQPPTPSPVEQAILNLSKQVDNFIKEQRAMTVQANQKTDTVESSLDKKLDGFQSEIDKKKNWTYCRNPSQSSPISLFIKRKKIQKDGA